MDASVLTIKPLIQLIRELHPNVDHRVVHCYVLVGQAFGCYLNLNDFIVVDGITFSDSLNDILKMIDSNVWVNNSIELCDDYLEFIKSESSEDICKYSLVLYKVFYECSVSEGDVELLCEKLGVNVDKVKTLIEMFKSFVDIS